MVMVSIIIIIITSVNEFTYVSSWLIGLSIHLKQDYQKKLSINFQGNFLVELGLRSRNKPLDI